jgi:threonine dehydrogenase-like Zn-dependent dehydrogenase
MGLGMIGLGVVQTLRMSGVTGVIGVDRSEIRLTQARELGAETVIDATGTDVADGVRATAGVGPLSSARVDTVFECSGAPAALSQAVEILRPGGHLVLVALYGETPHVDLNSVIAKQIEVHGAWAYRTEFVTTLELLGSDRLVADRLVTQTFPVAQTVEAFRAQMDPEKSVKVMVAPSDII